MLYPLLLLVLASAPLPTGTLTFDIDASQMPTRKICPGVLIAPDTVLTRAACLEFADGIERSQWRGRYDEGDFIAGVMNFDVHNDYLRVDCKAPQWQRACDAAEAYCRARWDGMEKVACLVRQSFYARTFTDAASHNLALVYLNRFAGTQSHIVDTQSAWFTDATTLDVMAAPETPLRLGVLRRDPADLVVESAPEILRAEFGYVTDGNGLTAVAALPSHFANLPHDADVPVNFVFTRLDSDADWVNVAMTLATRTQRRLGRDLPQRLQLRQPDPPQPVRPEPPESTDPTKPSPSPPVPTEPREPQDPGPAKPAPREPTGPEKPAPTEPAEPTPTRPEDPAEPAPTEPARPAEPQPPSLDAHTGCQAVHASDMSWLVGLFALRRRRRKAHG